MKQGLFNAFTGVFVLFGLLYACAHQEPILTPSGRPEVTIPDVTKKEVIGALTDMMMAGGFIVKSVTDDNAHFYIRTYRVYALPPFGPKPGELPEYHVSYDITEADVGVHIIATLWVIRYPSGFYRKTYDISYGRDANDIQKRLERLKATLAK
jgi:hypothetical protein